MILENRNSYNEKIKKKCADTFQKRVSKISPNIIIKGNYINARESIEAYCTIHNYTWFPKPYNLLSGFRCPFCGKEKSTKKRRKSISQILIDLEAKQPTAKLISSISEIANTRSNITMICDICGYKWTASIMNLTKNNNTTGCPNCAKIRVANSCRKTLEQLQKETSLINTSVEPISDYINTHSPVLCRCKIHTNTTFYQIPTTILNGANSCPKCTIFKHEKIMLDVLEKYHLKYTAQKTFEDCRDINKLPFDAFLDNYNVAIEYDGEGHYYPIPRYKGDDGIYGFERTKLHDKIKNEYCKNNDITLIRIPYWEQDNIEKFLLSELLKNNINVT